MLKLKKYQQYILGLLASFAFILIGAAVLAISLFSANRQQAANIKEITTSVIDAYSQEDQ